MSKRYVVSDLHGQLDLYNQIKEYINERDIVYALGDFGDRGPEPWRTLKSCLDDPQFIYLMGNHDLMLIQAIEWIINYSKCNDFVWDLDLEEIQFVRANQIENLIYNGGWATLCQWAKEPKRIHYYHQLCNLPLEIVLSTKDKLSFIYLSHAGYNPDKPRPYNIEDFVWDRLHFYHNWKNPKDNKVIHGHTPIEILVREIDEYKLKGGCLYYNDGAKICIDKCAHLTKETVLLDLDTFEGKVFKVRGEE